jgi:nucleoid-associated protein YgaU
LRMEGSADEKDGKLYFHGTVNSEDEKNQIWNALKTVPDWQKDIVADIRVKPGAAAQAPAQAAPSAASSVRESVQTYTVQAGDTLGGIAKRLLGNANSYMEIFNLNRDQLTNPDMIKPGQVLKIPQHA